MPGHDIIVVGASAGGVEALQYLAGHLPADLPSAVFVVLHIPAHAPSLLPNILARVSQLQCVQAADGDPIQPGYVYVAPPDYHMMVDRGFVRLVRGPRENRHRPAVDPLFRSAAVAYGPRVIGVVLTGALDDGTAGLRAIKQMGGLAVVQDPEDALYPGMPTSAINNVAVDYCLPLAEIPAALARLSREQAEDEANYTVPEDLILETRIVEDTVDPLVGVEKTGTRSIYSCPECHGVLWEVRDGEILRYRCQVGHAYSVESMLAEQSESVERALWVALRALEERSELTRQLAARSHERGQQRSAEIFAERAAKISQDIALLRSVLLSNDEPPIAEQAG